MVKKKKRRKRRSQSSSNQMARVIGDTAQLAIGAAVVTSVTTTTINALKK